MNSENIVVNQMVDAPLFSSAAYSSNASDVIQAKAAGIGIKNGTIASFTGNLWRRLTDGYVMSDSFTNNRVYESWMGTYSANIAGMADNGLIYSTNDNTTYQSDAGYQNPADSGPAYNRCASIGMRLPHLPETGVYGNTSGIPSQPYGWTWTDLWVNPSSSQYEVWSGSNYYYGVANNNWYVRCVR